MTTEEFKKLKPEYKKVEGDQLWNAMEDYMLQQQSGSEIIKSIMPIWKTHTLRWLYYRRIPNLVMGNLKTDKYASVKRCNKCKLGVNARMEFIMIAEDGTRKCTTYCPHCGKEYKEEQNTNLSHRFYKSIKWISKLFWFILDKLHLVRSSIEGRYGMFGDEARYVKSWRYNKDWTTQKPLMKNRKWWEYILIEKSPHNF